MKPKTLPILVILLLSCICFVTSRDLYGGIINAKILAMMVIAGIGFMYMPFQKGGAISKGDLLVYGIALLLLVINVGTSHGLSIETSYYTLAPLGVYAITRQLY